MTKWKKYTNCPISNQCPKSTTGCYSRTDCARVKNLDDKWEHIYGCEKGYHPDSSPTKNCIKNSSRETCKLDNGTCHLKTCVGNNPPKCGINYVPGKCAYSTKKCWFDSNCDTLEKCEGGVHVNKTCSDLKKDWHNKGKVSCDAEYELGVEGGSQNNNPGQPPRPCVFKCNKKPSPVKSTGFCCGNDGKELNKCTQLEKSACAISKKCKWQDNKCSTPPDPVPVPVPVPDDPTGKKYKYTCMGDGRCDQINSCKDLDSCYKTAKACQEKCKPKKPSNEKGKGKGKGKGDLTTRAKVSLIIGVLVMLGVVGLLIYFAFIAE